MKKNSRILFSSVSVVMTVLIFGFCPYASALAEGADKNEPKTEAKLTSEEALKMVAALKTLANRSTEGLVQERHADGSVSMDLQGRFQTVMVAKKEADGTVKQACVDNPKAAALFLGIDPRLLGSAKDTEAAQQKTDSKKSDQH